MTTTNKLMGILLLLMIIILAPAGWVAHHQVSKELEQAKVDAKENIIKLKVSEYQLKQTRYELKATKVELIDKIDAYSMCFNMNWDCRKHHQEHHPGKSVPFTMKRVGDGKSINWGWEKHGKSIKGTVTK